MRMRIDEFDQYREDVLDILSKYGYLPQSEIGTLRNVPVKYNNRLTVCAGKAFSMRSSGKPIKIELSSKIFDTIPEDGQIKTFKHELIHLCANLSYGHNQGHNDNWKYFMKLCGLSSDRCHTYPVNRRTIQKNYALTCLQCDYEYACTARIYNNNKYYLCPVCSGNVRLIKRIR